MPLMSIKIFVSSPGDVAQERFLLLVLGMSGCGKSSLIRAGVLPALSRPGVIEGVGLCRRVILRPGDGLGDVFDALAAVSRRASCRQTTRLDKPPHGTAG